MTRQGPGPMRWLTRWREQAPLLVYDPEHTGKVNSASQLFGQWTFGGQRLAALASDGRGLVSGPWENGFDALILHDMALRQHKEPPTVIIASGADISACLKNPEVISKIKSADNLILAKERAEDPAKQFVMDQNYSKKALKIKQITGKEAVFYMPPENVFTASSL